MSVCVRASVYAEKVHPPTHPHTTPQVAQARQEMDEIVKRWTETTLAQSAFAQSAMDDGPMTAAEFEVRCFPREGGGRGKGERKPGGGNV